MPGWMVPFFLHQFALKRAYIRIDEDDVFVVLGHVLFFRWLSES